MVLARRKQGKAAFYILDNPTIPSVPPDQAHLLPSVCLFATATWAHQVDAIAPYDW